MILLMQNKIVNRFGPELVDALKVSQQWYHLRLLCSMGSVFSLSLIVLRMIHHFTLSTKTLLNVFFSVRWFNFSYVFLKHCYISSSMDLLKIF